MANYDLGTIGYTVENKGAPESISELKLLAAQGLAAHRALKDFGGDKVLPTYLKSIDTQIMAVNRKMQEHSRYVGQAASRMNQFGVVTQQAGYQVGDFLVQVQSGTNWMVAFGQQATQLVGVLPLMEGAFGLSTTALIGISAGLGIAIPLITALGAAWMRTREESEPAIMGIAEATSKLREETEKLRKERERLNLGLGSEEEVTILREIEKIQGSIVQAQKQLQSRPDDSGWLNLLQSAQERLAIAQRDLETRRQEKVAVERLLFLEERRNSKLREARELIWSAEAAVKDLIAAAPGDSWMDKAISGVGKLVGALRVAAAEADKVRRASSMEFSANYITTVAERALSNYEAETKGMREGSPGRPDGVAGVDWGTSLGGAGGGGGGGGSAADPMAELQKEIDRRTKLLSLTQQEAALQEEIWDIEDKLGESRSKYSDEFIQNMAKQNLALEEQKRLQEEVWERQNQLAETLNSSMSDAFMSMVEGTKTVGQAFKDMAREIIKQLFDILVIQQIVGSWDAKTGTGTGLSGMLMGGLTNFLGGSLSTGGSMVAGKPYLVGEKGPEIVVPRHSGTVKNAQESSGMMGGNGGITVNTNISVVGSDAATVRKEVAKMIPQITEATKSAVISARQRGGSMKAAFQ